MTICRPTSRVRRAAYYQELGQPLEADTFIASLQKEMTDALAMLDRALPANPDVRIVQRSNGKSAIRLSPLTALPDPPNLLRLKLELGRRWPDTSLLDMFKEVDLRIGVTQQFITAGVREHLDRACSRSACCCACTPWAPTPASNA